MALRIAFFPMATGLLLAAAVGCGDGAAAPDKTPVEAVGADSGLGADAGGFALDADAVQVGDPDGGSLLADAGEPVLDGGGAADARVLPLDGGALPPDGGDAATAESSGDGGADAAAVPLDGSLDADAGASVVDGGDAAMDGSAGNLDGGGASDAGDAASQQDDDGGTQQGGGLIRGDAPTLTSASKAGPYTVQSFSEGLRDGPAYADATLWFPTDAEPPYAMAAVVTGFASTQQQIANWGPFLASHGIVAVTVGTNSTTDLPAERAAALLDALETVAAEQTREASPLAGKLDLTRRAVIGWSMGGGGALLAAEQTPRLKAAISLAGWNAGYDYGKVTVPSMLLAVYSDSLAGGQSQGFYESIPGTTPKLLGEVDNMTAFFGGHDTFCDPAGLGGAAGRYGLSWLKVFLEGDERYRTFLKQEPPQSTDYRTNL